MERLKLDEFDFMGLFTLMDVKGIEDLVTPLENRLYLSRNYDYYKRGTCSEFSNKREDLKRRLTCGLNKKNFKEKLYLPKKKTIWMKHKNVWKKMH